MRHHGAGLRKLGADQEWIETLAGDDPLAAELSEIDRALVRYSLDLTGDPSSIRADAVEALRRAGLDDRAIHDACQVVAYFNYVNRVADGLGVELEPWHQD